MDSIKFTNAGYNIAEPPGLSFHWSLNQHAFLYFQGPVLINGREYNSGTCILYKGGSPHNYKTQKGFVNSFIGFYCPDELFTLLNIPCNSPFFPNNCQEINDMFFSICQENALRPFGFEVTLKARILELLVTIGKGSNKQTSKKLSDNTVKMTAIRAEYLSDLVSPPDFDNLLLTHGFSRTQGYMVYSRVFNSSPKEDLIWARLEKSRMLMQQAPNMKIYEIAESCGFPNIPHFFRTFKKRYGYTPKHYMNALKSEQEN
ncbi:MAG: helix-turn-helix transcriptional regulator [Clostridia bacterium]|nr:helix-turn-helix transcriptional regulator [Clostridia bacterium]